MIYISSEGYNSILCKPSSKEFITGTKYALNYKQPYSHFSSCLAGFYQNILYFDNLYAIEKMLQIYVPVMSTFLYG